MDTPINRYTYDYVSGLQLEWAALTEQLKKVSIDDSNYKNLWDKRYEVKKEIDEIEDTLLKNDSCPACRVGLWPHRNCILR